MTEQKYKRKRIEEVNEIIEVIETKLFVDKEMNTDKQLKDYKIFVFDLDNTLYLHKVDQNYAKIYHKKVKNLLVYLKDNDKILYIATHNFNPDNYLNRINISPSLFNGIIKETKDVHPMLNSINDYTSKKDMILEIVEQTCLTTDDIVFFDDHNFNIKEVEKVNVKSVYVDDLKGIDFSEIY